jgi:hypothetical protein
MKGGGGEAVEASGRPWRWLEASQRRRRACSASVQEEEERWPVGPCGWAGPAGRPRPSGKGRENRPVKKILGRKAGWAQRDWEIFFPNKI